MDLVSRMVRHGALLSSAIAIAAIGVLSFTWLAHPVGAMQSGEARQAARMLDGTEFPAWEQPLQFSKTYYVAGNAANADDAGPGTKERPFRTIGRAAEVLQPGERVVIGEGIYREVVRPQRGGSAATRMISYEAAEGAKVTVRGSVVVKGGWTANASPQGRGGGTPSQARTWDVDLDGNWFGGYNPFGMMNMPQQRWQYMNRMNTNVHAILVPYTRMRGMMFVDGKPLDQVRVTSELLSRDPTWANPSRGQPYSAELFQELGGVGGKYFVDQSGLSMRVRLPNDDSPDKHLIEVTTKAQVFAPARGLGYIRVKGITFEHAGNGFPFPQTGMVSTNGGHHWIIEGNTFQWANSICLVVGGGGGGAPAGGGNTTSHIIRGNVIRNCGIGGLSGMGTRDLLVEDNLIEWVGWQDAEHMSESAGIKFHNARNLLLRNNVIRHMRHASGIWLDVGNINCRLTRNVFTDIFSAHAAIWIEASHEQDQVDNNIIVGVREPERLTPPEVEVGGGSGLYVLGTDKLIVAQNLIADCKRAGVHFRTEEIRLIEGRGGTARGNRVYNNIFFNTGESAVNFENEHNDADGNLYAGFVGGFLRILTPGRPELLNIPAAREYHGWEKSGQTGGMTLTLDLDNLTLTLSTTGTVQKVKTFNGVSITSDFFGAPTGDVRLPGAFADLSPLKARSIDPRGPH